MATVRRRDPDVTRRRRRETEHAAQHQQFLRGRPYEVIRSVRGALGELWSDKAGLFGVAPGTGVGTNGGVASTVGGAADPRPVSLPAQA